MNINSYLYFFYNIDRILILKNNLLFVQKYNSFTIIHNT